MVQPDRPTPTEPKPQRPRLVVIVATTLLFVIAAFTVGRLTSPGPGETAEQTAEPTIATPATSTTTTVFDPDAFRIVDVEQGPSLVWARVHGVPSTFPVALVAHQGHAYLFGADQPSWARRTTAGLQAWSTDDGIFWSSHGEVIEPGYRTNTVISTDAGLVALGENLAGPEPLIWVSDDASSWSRIALPLPRELNTGELVELWTGAASEDELVVVGSVYLSPEHAAAEYLPAEFDELAEQYGYGFGAQSLQIQAPFGITIYSATREELNMPLETWARLNTGGYHQTYVWTSADRGATWGTADFVEARGVQTTWIDDDGTLQVIGYGTLGLTRWTSSDGEVWGANQIGSELEQVAPWGDGFAATYWRLNTPDVSISGDGQTWTPVGLGQVLPNEISWQIGPLMAGETGIAAVVTGHRPEEEFVEPEPYLDKEGYRLAVDYEDGQIALFDIEAGTLIASYPTYTGTVSEYTEIDLENQTVTFLDHRTGDPLVTVTFEELRDAEEVSWVEQTDPRSPLRGFFFSPDGESWSLDEIGYWLSTDDVAHMATLEDRLIVLTLDQFWYRSDTPQSRLWMGILPNR